jgi:hypothetical protein
VGIGDGVGQHSIGALSEQMTYGPTCCCIADGLPATGMGAGCDASGDPATPEELLDERLADPKEGCHSVFAPLAVREFCGA